MGDVQVAIASWFPERSVNFYSVLIVKREFSSDHYNIKSAFFALRQSRVDLIIDYHLRTSQLLDFCLITTSEK